MSTPHWRVIRHLLCQFAFHTAKLEQLTFFIITEKSPLSQMNEQSLPGRGCIQAGEPGCSAVASQPQHPPRYHTRQLIKNAHNLTAHRTIVMRKNTSTNTNTDLAFIIDQSLSIYLSHKKNFPLVWQIGTLSTTLCSKCLAFSPLNYVYILWHYLQ